MATSLLAELTFVGTIADQVARFITILKDHLRLGNSNAKAVRTFVKLVTKLPYDADFEDTRKDYPVDRWGDDYMRFIIEKPTGFKSDYADEILEYLDTTALEKKVRALTPRARDCLAEALRIFDTNIGRSNLAEWIGDKAAELIADSSEKDLAHEIALEKVSLARQAFARTEYENFLLGEAQGLCSFTSCKKPLLTTSSGKAVTDVEIVIIDPHSDTASPANLLACCHDCAVSYGPDPSTDTVNHARTIKATQQREHAISDITAKRNVEEAIAKVIQQLPDADQADLNIDINEPLTVKTKLPDPQHLMLANKILTYVTVYFRYIDTTLKNNELIRPGGFDAFARTVADLFDGMDQAQATKSEIFRQLVSWLNDQTQGGIEACEAVISYFVQNCQVFR
ncbi:ABC-three component system protein [Corynebacterium diphtheriae]|uniref:ABC-three component system protein n=1 Tax=Corynebacterium diphtheriae TaxID=1717 RepID=UPI0008931ACD|nr:ABC-three component system protein [Corynebacterium diphtheriae]OFI54072.1 hypothetical protein BKD83_02685 [Corynebacterium diphtheriae]OSQ21214.1 hypothetical protein B1A52_03215 [Corynebacterium diphtheriae]